MRTYLLQDDGLDTFDANTTLAFDNDERNYGIAARMLRILNCTRTVLLANNRAKLYGFTKTGIEITAASRSKSRSMPTTPLYDGEGSACRTPVRSFDGLVDRSFLATFRRKISDFWIVADEVRKARPAALAAGVI